MDKAMANLTATVGPIIAAAGAFYVAYHLIKLIPRMTTIKAFITALIVSSLVLYLVQDLTRLINLGEIPYKALTLIGEVINSLLDSIAKGFKGG